MESLKTQIQSFNNLTRNLKPLKINPIVCKQIAIPTEIELYNLIANTYLLSASQLLFVSNKAIWHLLAYTYNITNQIKLRLDSSKYDFTLEELVKYIDSSTAGIDKNGDCDIDSIFNIENLTYRELLMNPLEFYDCKGLTSAYGDFRQIPIMAINDIYYKESSNNDIDKLKRFSILEHYKLDENLQIYEVKT